MEAAKKLGKVLDKAERADEVNTSELFTAIEGWLNSRKSAEFRTHYSDVYKK